VLGDAAHPMSPFKGQGANQALLDGLFLADVVVREYRASGLRDTQRLSRGLRLFELEMIRRTRPKVLGSRKAVAFLHSREATQAQYRDFRGVVGSHLAFLQVAGVGAWCADDHDKPSTYLDETVNRVTHRWRCSQSAEGFPPMRGNVKPILAIIENRTKNKT